MKVVFVNEPAILKDHATEVLSLPGIEFAVHSTPPFDERQIVDRTEGADVAVIDPSTEYPSHILRRLPGLKTIVTMSVATHHIDTRYCNANNINVISFPRFNAQGAAEAAITQASILRHQLSNRPLLTDRQRSTTARELDGCTLGVVGAGHVGAAIVNLGRALGMQVLCHTRRGTPERARSLGLRSFTTMREVLRESEIIIAAVGGGHDAKNAIDSALLREMQPDAVFVNIGQWNSADIYTLADMKYRGVIAGVAIDCNAPGPPSTFFDNVLIQEFMRTPGVHLTPDKGAITDEARARLATQLRETITQLASRQAATLRSTRRGH
jgi:D-3-phosphoglycerate dehydrogenase / 2-oxoglutarate reductase